MTNDPELARAVRSWLDEGADRLPDRVLDSVLASVPTTRQRRSPWLAWRFNDVSNLVRIAAVAAAVVAVGVVGSQLLPSSGSNVGATPTASPAPISSPTPAPPDPSQTFDILPSAVGAVIAGGERRVAAPFEMPFTLTVPDGTKVAALNAGEAGFVTPNGYVGALIPTGVFPDPCHTDTTPAVPQTTVDGFIEALSAMEGFNVGAITDTTVAGHSTRWFLVTNTVDTPNANCSGDLMLPMFTYVGNTDGAATNGGVEELFYVVDVDGTPVFVVLDGFEPGADLDALRAVVDSIRFE